MGKVTDLKFFAALRGRVVSMEHITALDFRVLGIIAFHDRMGRNGQHAWVSRSRIAFLAKCDPVSVSASMRRLIGLGLLKVEEKTSDNRRRIYSVIYKPQDDADALGITLSENRLRNGDLITCPIPARAILDDGLSPLHFKVLSIISHYYRFGKNGQGCWKKREKLAAHIGCTPSRYSMALTHLMNNSDDREGMALVGVLDKPHSDGRRKHYGSVYVLEQDAQVLRKARQKAPGNRYPSTLPIQAKDTGNRYPDHYPVDQADTEITPIKQRDEVIENQTEYIRRSQTYLDKSKNLAKLNDFERKGKRDVDKNAQSFGMKPWDEHEDDALVRILGNDGWAILTELEPVVLGELRRQVADDALTLETLNWARNCAAKAVASG